MVRSILFAFSLISALLMVLGSARADESAGEDARYRATLKEALAEYDANRFEEARILFRRAHELNPNARTLRSIGMASFELRDYVAALRALSAALVETRKPLNAEQRAHAQGLLDKSRMFVDVYALKIAPADARLLVDGRPVDAEPDGTILLGFGTHTFEASKPGYSTRTLSVNVRGGERKELSMTLERRAVASARPAPEVVAPPPVSLVRAPTRKTGVWWFIGAGVAALAAGGSAYGWVVENKELNTCNKPPEGYGGCDNTNDIRLFRNFAVVGTIGAGAAAVTLAVIGFVSRQPANDQVASQGFRCLPTLSGVWCQHSF